MRLALYQPDIPQNAGALIRLGACLGVGVEIIEPMGFILDDRRLRRAHMDYLAHAQIARHASWERFLDRIPVVKTIYGATRDFVRLIPAGGKRRDLRRVVLARFGEAQVIGFVTQDDAAELGIVHEQDGLVAVYFPMSYQIGGYTALLPRSRVVPLDLPVEAAMRMVLTGGVSGAPA